MAVRFQSSCLWLVVVVVSLWSANACFIRNCPLGGKRGLNLDATRQCMACGPGNKGQCVGPSICCGRQIGCLMGAPEAEVCQKENESSVPCSVRGRQCGVDNMGNCVADGICCVEDACSYNSHCKMAPERARESEGGDPEESSREELLGLIRRLLINRQYD